jgi:hypothetical protein
MINTVEKQYSNYETNSVIENQFTNYKIVYSSGKVVYAPLDEANRHYQEILEWVAAGNTITDPGA